MNPVEIIAHAKLAAHNHLPVSAWYKLLCEFWPDFITEAEFERALQAATWAPPAIATNVELVPVTPKQTEAGEFYLIAHPGVGIPFFALHKGEITKAPNGAALYRLHLTK